MSTAHCKNTTKRVSSTQFQFAVIYELGLLASSSAPKQYVVRFEGNNSRKWDGKEVWVDPEVLDELYDSSELFHGAKIKYPWRGKGGKITHWNGVFVDPELLSTPEPVEKGTAVAQPIRTDSNASVAAASVNKVPNKGMYKY